nr:TlpA disulfide reductase family protein [uncultured Carboxylicivirga sp.]
MKIQLILLFVFAIPAIIHSQEMKPLKPITNTNIISEPDYIVYKQLEINKPMPEVNGITIDDILIDSLFFQDKVTVLNFSFVGCPPCMQEVKYLNQISEKYKNQEVNVLSIYSINREGLLSFIQAKEGIYKELRQHIPFDTICYKLMPECLGEKDDYRYSAGPKCNRISKYYGIQGYPQTIIIDKNRIVRYIEIGFAKNEADAEVIKNKWIEIIDKWLQEPSMASN